LSKISDAYAGLKARIAAVLPSHVGLLNPYEPEQNPETILKQGYGIVLGAGTNSNRAISNHLSISREVSIVLTRRFYASEMNRTAKETVEKQLMEDQFLIVKDIEKDPSLGLSDVVANFQYEGDEGIQFAFSEDKPFYRLTMRFRLEYLENLN
jgi:hypothetical protein